MIALLLALVACDVGTVGPSDGGDDQITPGDPPTGDPTGPGGEINADCPLDEATLRAEAWDAVFQPVCASCHQAGGIGATSRLRFVPADSPEGLKANLALAATLAREDVNGESLLWLKPSGAHPAGHGGGDALSARPDAAEALRWFIDWSRGDACEPEAATCDPTTPTTRHLRRLTADELDATWADLLSLPRGRVLLAADPTHHGYDDVAALQITPLQADQIRDAAELAAFDAPLAAIVDCDPLEIGRIACATETIEAFGLRAFRRPLTPSDLDRYLAFWEPIAREEGFEPAIRWTITAILQSPHHLYRPELGVRQPDGSYLLTDWEIASALSYLWWGTMPDAALLADADAGRLRTPAGRQAAVDRLAADGRAHDHLAATVARWIGLGRLPVVGRDAVMFPGLDATVRAAMAGETHAFVRAVAASGGEIGDLLDADYTFRDPVLAAWLSRPLGDAPPDAQGFRRAPLDPGEPGGLLAHAGVLTTWALPSSSSPVQRGLLVRERLMCLPMPPPPPNLDTTPPPVEAGVSTRERYRQHSDDPACSGCHVKIDPIGFVFEGYDAAGRPRATDGGHPIDTSGAVHDTPSSDTTVADLLDLSTHLAGSADVQRCLSRVLVRLGAGHPDAAPLTCAADSLADGHTPGDLPVTAPWQALSLSPWYDRRVGAPLEADTLAAGRRLTLGALPEDSGEWADDVPDGATVTQRTSSDWGNGWCADFDVFNPTDTALAWSVRIPLDGTPYNVWNAAWTDHGDGTHTFVGVAWNQTVQPGATVTFGLCANR